MGLKTTIGNQGVVTEKIVGSNKVVIELPVQNQVTAVSAAGDANVTPPVTLFRPNGGAVTGTLPAIGDALVGREYLILNDAVVSSSILVSGTNPINDGGAFTLLVTASSDVIKLMAVSGSNGFYWHKIFQAIS